MLISKRNSLLFGFLSLSTIVLCLFSAKPSHVVQAQANTPVPTQVSDTTIRVVPEKTNVNAGEEFGVSIQINSDKPSLGLQLSLQYDPKLVEISSVTEGNYYKDWAVANNAQSIVMPEPAADNENGVLPLTAIIVVGGPPTQGPTGSGVLLDLRVKAKDNAKGSVEFKLNEIEVSDAGNADGNVAALGGVKSQNASVEIGGSTSQAAAVDQPTAAPIANLAVQPNSAPADGVQPQQTQMATIQAVGGSSGGNDFPWELMVAMVGGLVIGASLLIRLRVKA